MNTKGIIIQKVFRMDIKCENILILPDNLKLSIFLLWLYKTFFSTQSEFKSELTCAKKIGIFQRGELKKYIRLLQRIIYEKNILSCMAVHVPVLWGYCIFPTKKQ